MIKAAIDRILELAKPELFEIYGQKYSSQELDKIRELEPDALLFSSLGGLVDYVKNCIELDKGLCFAHVESYSNVRLYKKFQDKERKDRIKLASAEFRGYRLFPFDEYHETDNFTVMLNSRFQMTEDLARLTKLVGNISSGGEVKTNDDGFTQNVTVKAGVTLLDRGEVKNPFLLAPYRTFPDIPEQPASAFLLRLRKNDDDSVQVALFETDGNAWRLTAENYIKKFLKDNLDIPVV